MPQMRQHRALEPPVVQDSHGQNGEADCRERARQFAYRRATQIPGVSQARRHQQRFVTQQRGRSEQKPGDPVPAGAGDARCNRDRGDGAAKRQRGLVRREPVEPDRRRQEHNRTGNRLSAWKPTGRRNGHDGAHHREGDEPLDAVGQEGRGEQRIKRREDRLPLAGAEEHERILEWKELLGRIEITRRVRQCHRLKARARQLRGLNQLDGRVHRCERVGLKHERRQREQREQRAAGDQDRHATGPPSAVPRDARRHRARALCRSRSARYPVRWTFFCSSSARIDAS